MTRLTTIVVIVFMLTSLFLAIMYSRGRVSYPVRPRPAPVGQSVPVPSVPVPAAPPAPAAPAK
jgi:hypothetical protein